MLDYLVLYHSQTGNTKKIAVKIFESLSGNSKDLVNLDDCEQIPEARIYFVGFCVKHGTCNMKIIDVLGELSGKQVALFGTCGMGKDVQYYKSIEDKVKVWLEDDNGYLGIFLCQGKMPIQIREKYTAMPDREQVRKFLHNFDEAMTHPDETDLKNAEDFVNRIVMRHLTDL